MVLLKEVKENQGFIFFTNYGSRKAQEIDENPNVALVFYWDKEWCSFVLKLSAPFSSATFLSYIERLIFVFIFMLFSFRKDANIKSAFFKM